MKRPNKSKRRNKPKRQNTMTLPEKSKRPNKAKYKMLWCKGTIPQTRRRKHDADEVDKEDESDNAAKLDWAAKSEAPFSGRWEGKRQLGEAYMVAATPRPCFSADPAHTICGRQMDCGGCRRRVGPTTVTITCHHVNATVYTLVHSPVRKTLIGASMLPYCN